MRYEQGWSPCLRVTVPTSFKWCSTCATQQKMSLKSVSLTPEVCWLHSKWEESCRFSSLFRRIYWLSSTNIGGGLKKNELGLTSIIIYWLRLQLCCKRKERGTLIVSYSFAYLSLVLLCTDFVCCTWVTSTKITFYISTATLWPFKSPLGFIKGSTLRL